MKMCLLFNIIYEKMSCILFQSVFFIIKYCHFSKEKIIINQIVFFFQSKNKEKKKKKKRLVKIDFSNVPE